MDEIKAEEVERRFALASQPKVNFKDEINRLLKAKHINRTIFCECTQLSEEIYYRLAKKDTPPVLSTVITLCVGLSLDTMTSSNLIRLAGYTLRLDYELHRFYGYFLENSDELEIPVCNEFLEGKGYKKKGELLGSIERKKNSSKTF